MNSLDKEYLHLNDEIYGPDEKFDSDDDDYKTGEQLLREAGGLVSVEWKSDEIIYTAANGSKWTINWYPRLYDALVSSGDIEPVKLTEAEKELFSGMSRVTPLQIERIKEYIRKFHERYNDE